MKKEQKILLTISILCALAVLTIGVIMIFPQPEKTPTPTETTGETTAYSGENGAPENTMASQETQNNTWETAPEQQKPQKEQEEQVKPPVTDLPSNIVITPEKDPETGKPQPITFPCQVPGYKLSLEKLAPYKGMFVEDGTNVTVEQVAMLMVKNNGDFPVEYTQICVEYGEQQLFFDISALPVGETLVVQEKSCKALPQGDVTKATALIVQRAEMEMSQDQIKVTDNGNNTLTVENLTDETIPTTRVFYKYYMKEEGLFVGGIAFTVRIRNLSGGEKVVVQPAHYNSNTGRVVMVQTYGD